jgi:hypothetical protein
MALLIAAVLGAGPAATADASAPSLMHATAADEFVDSVGVGTHFRYTRTAYAHSEPLLERLHRLGVRHIRDGLPLNPSPELLTVLRRLPDYGIRANLVLGTPNHPRRRPLPPAADAVAAVRAAGLGDVVESLEAPNEWDLRSGGDWLEEVKRFQRDLHSAVRAVPELDGVAVLGPSVGRHFRVEELRGFGDSIDIANLHNYPRGGPPEDELEAELANARAMAPGKPLYVTETGYHTAVNQTDRQAPVSEQAKADYLTRTLLENYRLGVERTYIYQLVDGRPDPRYKDQEQHFGLLRNDLSEKPAYDAVRHLLTLLADPGPSFAPDHLAVSVVSEDADVQHLLLQKRDGTYYLVLWRQGKLYEDGRDILGSSPVTVSFGSRARTVELRAAADEPQPLGAVSELRGEIGNGTVVIEVAGEPSGTTGPSVARFDATATAVLPSTTAETPHALLPVGVAVVAGVAVMLFVVVLLVKSRRHPPITHADADLQGHPRPVGSTSDDVGSSVGRSR